MKYLITNNATGEKLTIEGTKKPTEMDAKKLFSEVAKKIGNAMKKVPDLQTPNILNQMVNDNSAIRSIGETVEQVGKVSGGEGYSGNVLNDASNLAMLAPMGSVGKVIGKSGSSLKEAQAVYNDVNNGTKLMTGKLGTIGKNEQWLFHILDGAGKEVATKIYPTTAKAKQAIDKIPLPVNGKLIPQAVDKKLYEESLNAPLVNPSAKPVEFAPRKSTPKKPTSYNPQMDALKRSLARTNQFNQNIF